MEHPQQQSQQFSSDAIKQNVYHRFPALESLFKKYPNRLAVHGEVPNNPFSLNPKKLKVVDIFLCGKGLQQQDATEILLDCVGIIGSLESPSSPVVSLTIERTANAVKSY